MAASSLLGLGEADRAQWRYQEAEKALRQAHEAYSWISDDHNVAGTWNCLGEIYKAQSRVQETEEALRQSHEAFSRIGHDYNVAVKLLKLGEIYLSQSRTQEAEQAFKQAHKIFLRLGNHEGMDDSVGWNLFPASGVQTRKLNYRSVMLLWHTITLFQTLTKHKLHSLSLPPTKVEAIIPTRNNLSLSLKLAPFGSYMLATSFRRAP